VRRPRGFGSEPVATNSGSDQPVPRPRSKPAAGEHVQRGGLLGEVGRRDVRQVDHRDAEPDLGGARRRVGQRQQRVEHAAVDRRQLLVRADQQPLERPQAVIAELLGAHREPGHRQRVRPRPGHRAPAADQHDAQDLVHEQGLWHGEAETRAARELAELLPRGVRTGGMILRTVTADGVPVGWVWAGLPAPPRPGLGWLHHIEIDESCRGRGHGRAAIAAVEAELARRGVRRMGLNVPGVNTGARRLCDRLGYRVLAQQMAKDLPIR
jgi:ribosomal protein S18 acetylase RimI-like enzyme